MSTRTRRPAWFHIALVVVMGVAAVVGVSRPPTSAAGFTVTVDSSAAAPGMVRVRWADEAPTAWTTYRVSWWLGTDTSTSPVERVVLASRYGLGPSTSVVIPNLVAGSTYTVRVEAGVLSSPTGPFSASGSADATATVQGTPAGPCNAGQRLCGTISAPAGAALEALAYVGESSAGMSITGGSFGLSGNPGYQPDTGTTGDWTRVRVNLRDRAGVAATTWWAAFDDEGATYDTATEVLVPLGSGAPTVQLPPITMVAGTRVSGSLTRVGPSGPVALTSPQLERLCVLVQRDAPGTGAAETVTDLCSNSSSGFGAADPAAWTMALQPGAYRVRFVDRWYPKRLASQWWRSDGTRGETRAASSLVDVTAANPVRLDAVLRLTKSLRIDVTGAPATATFGQAYVVDSGGVWTSGSFTLDPDTNVAGATLTGLTDGMPYKVFVSFYVGSGPGSTNQSWLVGGNTVADAAGFTPGGAVLTTPWVGNKPLLVTMHRPDAAPYGSGEACIALRAIGSASSSPDASACVANSGGVVLLQRVPNGRYRVVAYRRDPATKELVGSPIRLSDIEITDTLPTATPFYPGHGVVISDVSRLEPGASLTFPYSPAAAVVIP